MPMHRLTSTDAFLVVDLPGATRASGIVRCARKILPDGAELLARSVTYAAASFDERVSGASAGINAEGDARHGAIVAFAGEVASLLPEVQLDLSAGKGVRPDELSGAAFPPTQPGERERLIAAGAVAAAITALGSLDGLTVAVEAVPGVTAAVVGRLSDTGALLTDGAELTPATDVWFVGSKVGLIDHDVAADIQSRLVVPIGVLPVTARGLAVARRNDVMVLPDFLTCAGPLLADLIAGPLAQDDVSTGAPESEDLDAHVAQLIGAAIGRVLDHEHGPLLGACFAAEAFLATWVDQLPFGRPLA